MIEKYNPLKYDIHPLDFIRKKTIKELDETINMAENGLLSGEKIRRALLDELSGELFNSQQEYDEFHSDF